MPLQTSQAITNPSQSLLTMVRLTASSMSPALSSWTQSQHGALARVTNSPKRAFSRYGACATMFPTSIAGHHRQTNANANANSCPDNGLSLYPLPLPSMQREEVQPPPTETEQWKGGHERPRGPSTKTMGFSVPSRSRSPT